MDDALSPRSEKELTEEEEWTSEESSVMESESLSASEEELLEESSEGSSVISYSSAVDNWTTGHITEAEDFVSLFSFGFCSCLCLCILISYISYGIGQALKIFRDNVET